MTALVSERHRLPASPSAFYEEIERRGWGDGLPVIPPTEDLVREMMALTPLAPDHVVAEIQPAWRPATVEIIAVNAVMAGCEPVHLPAVIAAVEAVADPRFLILSCGTNPSTPVVVVNGPARSRMGLSCTYKTLGVGHRANSVVGRAVRLVLQNVGTGGAHDIVDQTTIGGPVKLGLCVAENEELSPWRPFHVDAGWSSESSTVTVFNASGALNLLDEDDRDAKSVIRALGRSMVAPTVNHFVSPSMPLLILGIDHSRRIAAEGYSKADFKRELWAEARLALDDFPSGIRDYIIRKAPRAKTPDGFVHITDEPEGIGVVVAGGSGPHSAFLPTLGANPHDAQTRQIVFKD